MQRQVLYVRGVLDFHRLRRLAVQAIGKHLKRPRLTIGRFRQQRFSRRTQPLAVVLSNGTPQRTVEQPAFRPVLMTLLERHMCNH